MKERTFLERENYKKKKLALSYTFSFKLHCLAIVFFAPHIWCGCSHQDKCQEMCQEKFRKMLCAIFHSQGINKAFHCWPWITVKNPPWTLIPSQTPKQLFSAMLWPGQHGPGERKHSDSSCHSHCIVAYLCLFIPLDSLDLAQMWVEFSREAHCCCKLGAAAYHKFICLLSKYHLFIHCETLNFSPECRFVPLGWGFVNGRAVFSSWDLDDAPGVFW